MALTINHEQHTTQGGLGVDIQPGTECVRTAEDLTKVVGITAAAVPMEPIAQTAQHSVRIHFGSSAVQVNFFPLPPTQKFRGWNS